MPLHPDLDDFLELANHAAAERLPMHQMTASQARAAYDNATLALDTPGPALAVDALQIPARDGALLGARRYRGAPPHQPAPVLLFFHGGGYVLGGLDSHDSLCRSLAAEGACDVLAVDYRLAPEHRFPVAFQDAEDALAWLHQQGPALALDSARLAVGGDSVGASLAAALCLAARDANTLLPMPLLQLLLYPCTAAFQDSPSHQRLASGYLLEHDNLQWMFRQYLRQEQDRQDWRFAPLQASSLVGLPPAHIALAEYDPLLDEGLAYASRLEAAGVPVSLQVYQGMVHDFARLGEVTDQAPRLRQALGAVLQEAFQAPTEHPRAFSVLA